MNLTTTQMIFLAGIINEMSEGARQDPQARIEGKFAIKLEWQPAGRGTPNGQYILRGIDSHEGTR